MATKKAAKRKTSTTDFEGQVREIAAMLEAYAPTRARKIRGAKSFAKLEALVPVPPDLRRLWSWADGAADLLVMSSDDLERAVSFYSVDEARKTLTINREAEDFPEDVIPFAGETGSGDSYVLDAKGRVLYWDHEEGATSRHAASVGVVLANTQRAIQKGALFGGPERKAGEVDKKVLRLEQSIETDLRDAASVSMAYNSPAHKIRGAIEKLQAEPDKHRLYLLLRDRLRVLGADAQMVKAVEESILYTAMATRSWEDALRSLKTTGGVVGGRDNWNVVGREALQVGELEVALRAFSGGKSTESRLAEVAVAKKLGRTPSRSFTDVAKTITKAADALRKNLPAKPRDFDLLDLVGALVDRAVVEKLAGDDKAARATLDEAYRHQLPKRFRDPVEANALAGLVGLAPRG